MYVVQSVSLRKITGYGVVKTNECSQSSGIDIFGCQDER
jgi:hypothetical protein